MGSVYLARDPAIDRNVAIKLLKEGFDNAELRERFMREARSAGRLRHINIVTIFDVGEHADQFSAGAVFYELLSDQQAFPGGLETGILHKIINANPEPLLSRDPKLDKGLVAIVEKCLEKSRDKRYPDMAAVRRDLSQLRRRLGVDDEQESGAETITGGKAPAPDEAAFTPRPWRKD